MFFKYCHQGSAAGCRGRTSLTTMDEIARFLAGLACDGVASSPVLGLTLDSTISQLSTISASALGAMLNVDGGNPLWKQRMVHLVAPILLSRLNPRSEDKLTDFEYGRLMCACHIICSVSLKSLGVEKLENLVALIVDSFERHVCECCQKVSISSTPDTLETISLAAMLQLMDHSPIMVRWNEVKNRMRMILMLFLNHFLFTFNTDEAILINNSSKFVTIIGFFEYELD